MQFFAAATFVAIASAHSPTVPASTSASTLGHDESSSTAPVNQVSADPAAKWWGRPPIGFLYFSGYYDTREALRLTGQAMALLPYGFDYYGFVDYDNAYAAPHLGEFDRYYGEQNLMWGPKGWGVDLHAQWAMGGGVDGDIPDALRGGVRWRIDSLPAISSWCRKQRILARLTYFPAVYRLGGTQVPGFHSQLSAFYRWEVFPEKIDRRIYVSGWIDVDLFAKGDKHAKLLTEHQLGVRIFGTLYAVAEFRHLYLDKLARGGEETGLGVGLEYQIPFLLPVK